MPSIDRKDNDDELYTDGGPEDTDWVGVLLYPDPLGVEETTGTASTSVCLLMLERVCLGVDPVNLLTLHRIFKSLICQTSIHSSYISAKIY